MSKLLALDASTEVCSVAVTDGSTVVQRYCDTPKSHSKVLLPLINEVLEEAKIALSDLDALAVTRGPGSFTGIRIGLGIIQGLSYGAKLPVIGLNTLDVMAEQYRATLSCMSGSIIVPALDARMGEVYWSAYRAENEHCEAVIPAAVCAPLCALEELKAQFSLEDVHGVGHGWSVQPLVDTPVSKISPDFKPRAEAALALAVQSYKPKMSPSAYAFTAVEPIYLRNEITWKKRQRIRDR